MLCLQDVMYNNGNIFTNHVCRIIIISNTGTCNTPHLHNDKSAFHPTLFYLHHHQMNRMVVFIFNLRKLC